MSPMLLVPISRAPAEGTTIKTKTALKSTTVKHTHFSSGRKRKGKDVKETSIVIRVLKGTNLLASDIMHVPPTSDPICFVWCGPEGEQPSTPNSLGDNEVNGFQKTSVIYGTVDPQWDEEVSFPLEIRLPIPMQRRNKDTVKKMGMEGSKEEELEGEITNGEEAAVEGEGVDEEEEEEEAVEETEGFE